MIAFLGGTFDPVHVGHLHVARAVRDRLPAMAVHLVLSARPVHRLAPIASIEDRWAMLTLAVAGESGLTADPVEMAGDRPSFTVETLALLRRERTQAAALAWVLGWDAYALLPSWHRWRDLLGLCHLIVVRRPGQDAELSPTMAGFSERHSTTDPGELTRTPSGRIYVLEAEMLSVSSTEIRQRCAKGEAVAHLLPPAVWTYIKAHHLYGGPPA